MDTITVEDFQDLGKLEVDFKFTPAEEGKRVGHPEDCYEGNSAYVEIDSVKDEAGVEVPMTSNQVKDLEDVVLEAALQARTNE